MLFIIINNIMQQKILYRNIKNKKNKKSEELLKMEVVECDNFNNINDSCKMEVCENNEEYLSLYYKKYNYFEKNQYLQLSNNVYNIERLNNNLQNKIYYKDENKMLEMDGCESS